MCSLSQLFLCLKRHGRGGGGLSALCDQRTPTPFSRASQPQSSPTCSPDCTPWPQTWKPAGHPRVCLPGAGIQEQSDPCMRLKWRRCSEESWGPVFPGGSPQLTLQKEEGSTSAERNSAESGTAWATPRGVPFVLREASGPAKGLLCTSGSPQEDPVPEVCEILRENSSITSVPF